MICFRQEINEADFLTLDKRFVKNVLGHKICYDSYETKTASQIHNYQSLTLL